MESSLVRGFKKASTRIFCFRVLAMKPPRKKVAVRVMNLVDLRKKFQLVEMMGNYGWL